jgi:hypothetical protein
VTALLIFAALIACLLMLIRFVNDTGLHPEYPDNEEADD